MKLILKYEIILDNKKEFISQDINYNIIKLLDKDFIISVGHVIDCNIEYIYINDIKLYRKNICKLVTNNGYYCINDNKNDYLIISLDDIYKYNNFDINKIDVFNYNYKKLYIKQSNNTDITYGRLVTKINLNIGFNRLYNNKILYNDKIQYDYIIRPSRNNIIKTNYNIDINDIIKTQFKTCLSYILKYFNKNNDILNDLTNKFWKYYYDNGLFNISSLQGDSGAGWYSIYNNNYNLIGINISSCYLFNYVDIDDNRDLIIIDNFKIDKIYKCSKVLSIKRIYELLEKCLITK